MAKLSGAKGHENLKAAYAGQSRAKRSYFYVAEAEKSHAEQFAKRLNQIAGKEPAEAASYEADGQ